MFLLVYFQWLYLLELFVFACLLILSGLKVKNYFRNILIIEYIKMDMEPLKIKTQDNFNWDDIIYINDFDEDSLEIINRESKIGVNIYYIKYSTLRLEDQINPNIKIKDCDKFRFNSDIDLPLNTAIEFRSLVINVSCIIEKDNEYYREIYLDECLYVKDNTWYAKSLLSGCIKFPTEGLFSRKYNIK